MKLPGYRWVVLGLAIGIAAGVGAYTFAYAKGWSYLTDNAAACANCHVMQEQYDGWLKSSHRSAAVCNDCPHTCHVSRKIQHQSTERLLAFLLFHHGLV